MNYYEALSSSVEHVDITPGDTSYFSNPASTLDPRLFSDNKLRSNVRDGILALLFNHLQLGYNEPEAWSVAWLAGSGVSYNWMAHREPADLDCLVGINYVQFRQSNQEYKGWSDREIAAEINQGFRNELHPRTESFMDTYELTFYVNLQNDITKIKPYAAYSVTDDTWTVRPENLVAPVNPEWERATLNDVSSAKELINRYGIALEKVRNSVGTPARVSNEAALRNIVEQGAAIFDSIHEARNSAFSEGGEGYSDFANYRWQAGKQSGIIQSLKQLKDASKRANTIFATETYGVELPDVDTLIRRASRNN
jgi:hypothetical protein